MQSMFQCSTKYTFEVYSQYCKVVDRFLGHFNRNRVIYVVVCAALGALTFGIGRPDLGFFFLALCGIIPAMLTSKQKQSIKKAWDKNEALHDQVFQYSFYPDHLVQTNYAGSAKFHYANIGLLIETADAFYLMFGKKQGLVIEKCNCTARLAEFIRRITPKGPGQE